MPITNSIVDYLNSLGQDASRSNRQKLAEQYGISDYTGSAEQNTDLLAKLRAAENIEDQPSSGTTNPVKLNALDPDITEFANKKVPFRLVKFDGDADKNNGPATAATVWFVSTEDQSMRPFLSETAFNTFFARPGWGGNWQGMTLQDAIEGGEISKAPMSLLNDGYAFSNYELLGNDQGIQNDGSIQGTGSSSIDLDSIKKIYGKPLNEELANKSLESLFGMFDLWSEDISAETISTAKNDPEIIALYNFALAFGEYDINDIFIDLKRRELLNNGDKSMDSIKVIDEKKTGPEYHKTSAYLVAKSNPKLQVPAKFKDIDSSLLDLPLFDMPNEVYSVLNQPTDWTTPEAKAEIEKIDAAFYDILTQRLESNTERAKTAADYNWSKFQENIEKAYGIRLSDDSFNAWGQIQEMTSGFSQKGLGQSGLEAEAKDRYLRDIRRGDTNLRDQKLDEKEQEKRSYYMTSATADQIANDLTSEERDDWGLTPSKEDSDFFNMENLKKKFPNASEDELKKKMNMIIDSSGNYRSSLYQTLFENKYDVSSAKKDWQLGNVDYDSQGNIISGHGYMYNKLLEEEKARKEHTGADNHFSVDQGYQGSLPTDDVADTTPDTPTPDIPTPTGLGPKPTTAPSNANYEWVNQGGRWVMAPKKKTSSSSNNIVTPDPIKTTETPYNKYQNKIPNLDIMGKYKSTDYFREDAPGKYKGGVYLNKDVKKLW